MSDTNVGSVAIHITAQMVEYCAFIYGISIQFSINFTADCPICRLIIATKVPVGSKAFHSQKVDLIMRYSGFSFSRYSATCSYTRQTLTESGTKQLLHSSPSYSYILVGGRSHSVG